MEAGGGRNGSEEFSLAFQMNEHLVQSLLFLLLVFFFFFFNSKQTSCVKYCSLLLAADIKCCPSHSGCLPPDVDMSA